MTSNKFVCIDYSGSTGNHRSYWERAFKIALANDDATFFFWDTQAKKSSCKDVMQHCQTAKGNGGTDPSCIAQILKTMTNVELILITDGQIDARSVTSCDNILNAHQFNSVCVYFINTGGQMNLSVSSPFTRNTKLVKIYVDDKCLVDNLALTTLDLTKYYNNPTLFMDEADGIFKHIVLTNLGKTNTTLRNDLLDLQKNLMNYIANIHTNADGFKILRASLMMNDYEIGLYSLKKLLSYEDTQIGKKIETIIQQLINQCNNSSNFSFDLLQPGRLSRSPQVKSTAAEELPEVENHSGFECPILIDDLSVPVLMIRQGEPVLDGLDKNYLDSIMTNPFMVLENDELVQKTINRFDHVVSLSAFKQMFNALDNHNGHGNELISPFTRKNITCLLSTINEKSHIKATNYALANLLFGKKLVGLPEIWLAVIYFVLHRVEYLSNNKEFFETFTTDMLDRMRNRRTNITLSGLPIEPMIKAPIDLAIWYCVVSPHLSFSDLASNRLRSFGTSSKYLVDLVDLLHYPYDKPWTMHRLNIYKAFAWMMNQEKSNTDWRMHLRAQYQASIELSDGVIILLDGPAKDNKPKISYFDLTLDELVYLATLVDLNKSVNAIIFPDILTSKSPRVVINYGYPATLTEAEAMRSTAIDPDTYRPYIIDRKTQHHWLICSEQIYGPINRQLSSYNYFAKYVQEYGTYPTKEQFIKYMADKQANRENAFDTLPSFIPLFVDVLFSDYEAVLGPSFANVSSSHFIAKAYAKMTNKKNADYYF